MRRNLVDVMCAIAIFAIVIFLGYMGKRSEPEFCSSSLLTEIEVFQTTGIYGILQLFCAVFGAVKLFRCAVESRESTLAGPALLTGVRKHLDDGRIDLALSRAESDSRYAGRVVACALRRKSVGGDVRRGGEDAGELEYSRLRGTVDTLLGVGIVGFLLGLLGAVLSLWYRFLMLETLRSPTVSDLIYKQYEFLATLIYGILLALVFVPAFLVMKRRVATNVSKVNIELGVLLDRVALQE